MTTRFRFDLGTLVMQYIDKDDSYLIRVLCDVILPYSHL